MAGPARSQDRKSGLRDGQREHCTKKADSRAEESAMRRNRIARPPCARPRHGRQAADSPPNASCRTKLAFTPGILRLLSEATLHSSAPDGHTICSSERTSSSVNSPKK